MARLVDYQFESFYRDADHHMLTPNAGTLGETNDGVLYTGIGVNTDGSSQIIVTDIYPDKTYLSGLFMLHFNSLVTTAFSGCHDDNDRRLYLGNYNDVCRIAYGTSYNNSSDVIAVINDPMLFGFAYDPSAQNLVHYIDGVLSYEASGVTFADGASTAPFTIGAVAKSLGSYEDYIDGGSYFCAFFNVTMTEDDFIYLSNNREAVIEMVLTGQDNPNLSFGPSNVLHLIPIDEALGTEFHDLVTGSTFIGQNFPGDDSQWAFDFISRSHQSALFKKGENHNPSALTEQHTVRLD